MSREKYIPKSDELLFSQAKAADNDEWIIFRSKQIPVTSQRLEQLKQFLEEYKPSQVTRSSGVGWISGSIYDHEESGYDEESASDEESTDDESIDTGPVGAVLEWKKWTGVKNLKTVNVIAKKYNVTVGKWMVHVSTDIIDMYWERLAMAMMKGELGNSVHSMKVICLDVCSFIHFIFKG